MATRNAVLCLFVLGIAAGAATVGSSTATPSTIPASVATNVTFTSVIADPTVIASTVNLQQLDSSGRATVVGVMHDDGLNGDAAANDHTFTFQLSLFQQIAGNLTYRVSAGFQGSLARVLSAPFTVSVTGVSTGITITSPPPGAYLNISPTVVTGTVASANSTVKVNNIPAQVSGTTFSVSIPLQEGTNPLTAVATNGGATATASETVTLDTTPPHVTIDTPTANATTTDTSINVGGIVNDIVVGTINPLQATVSVNGVAAQVVNRTYIAASIPLQLGANTLTATARDRAGNFATTAVTVTRQAATQPTLRIISGNNLTGPIRTRIAAPLVVQAVNASGQPITNTPVVFTVTGGDGTVSAGASSLPAVAVNTNSQGQAQVILTLGSRAGAGNNIVQASAVGISNNAVFTESATTAAPVLIVVDSGNNQSGVVGQALPLPFIAIVTDSGNNRLGNVPVSFTVTGGGGTINGVNAVTATSDSDGRVQAILTLGAQAGINGNVVTASFAGNSGLPATFTATSYVPGPVQNTSITGVVLDNSNNPLAGVTMRLYQLNNGSTANIPVQIGTPVQTNALGYFSIQPAPVGVFKLMADGTTATTPGSYPTLEYDIVTVAGQNNTVGQPIYLPQIASASRLCVSPTVGGTLTIPQAPGFALSIAPGSATFPGGTQTGCVSVTPVNLDKVPMVPGFGQQPRFIVTIQPVGTTFNPPAQITIPNVDGLAPRAVTEMYSYDHDLASFVAIGTATVSADGSVIASDPGVGVLKAGWHCGGDPNANGTVADCPSCKICQNNACVTNPAQEGASCPLTGGTGICVSGVCQPMEYDPGTAITDDFNIPGIHSIPFAKNNIGVSPSEKVIFNLALQDKDRKRRRGTAAWTDFDGTGPYVITMTITGPGSWDSLDSGTKTTTRNSLSTGNIFLYANSNWPDGQTITVTAKVTDGGGAPPAPDVGTVKDPDFTITWTIVKRSTCPTTIQTVVGAINVFRADIPAVYTYHLGPALPAPAMAPYYENQTILESFQAVSAFNFTMTDVLMAFKTAHPAITTPDMVVQFFWPLNIFNNGTFVINSDDRMADQHSGGAGHDEAFTAAAIAAGYGFSLPQTYSCGPNHLQDYTITHRYTNGVQNVRKTGP
jgi:hypothetical protein